MSVNGHFKPKESFLHEQMLMKGFTSTLLFVIAAVFGGKVTSPPQMAIHFYKAKIKCVYSRQVGLCLSVLNEIVCKVSSS